MKKRKWVYVMKPTAYEIRCDICGGSNITWSEFEHMIWCYDCEKDTRGTGGIFDGPIPVNAMALMGISLDKIDIKTGNRLYMKIDDINGKINWSKNPTRP